MFFFKTVQKIQEHNFNLFRFLKYTFLWKKTMKFVIVCQCSGSSFFLYRLANKSHKQDNFTEVL